MILVHKAYKGPKVIQVLKDHRAIQVHKDPKVILGRKVSKATLVHKDHKVILAVQLLIIHMIIVLKKQALWETDL